MSQYGEPISLDPDRDIHGTEFYSGFTPNGGKSTLWEDIENPLAERMVKCMNDCAGIDDPAATIRDLRAENERLRESLEVIAMVKCESDCAERDPVLACPTCIARDAVGGES